MLFFGYWLFDGFVRDWWHARQQPTVNPIAWDQVQPGASAAELDAALGGSLPFVVQAAPAPPVDYMIPAQVFDLPATPTPPPADPRPTRMIVGRMQLDSAINEVFLHDGVWEVAEYAVGYHHGTALPGTGNTVLAGHAGFRGGVFARLHELALGDDIYIDTANTRFHYRVVSTFSVGPEQVEVMYPTSTAQITMITCTAWDTQRLIVVAELVDQAPLSSSVGGGT
jgi:sortase A